MYKYAHDVQQEQMLSSTSDLKSQGGKCRYEKVEGVCSINKWTLFFIHCVKWFYKSIEGRGVINSINVNIHCCILKQKQKKTPGVSNFRNKKLKTVGKNCSDSFNFMQDFYHISCLAEAQDIIDIV